MSYHRITDPSAINRSEIIKRIEDGHRVIIQFSKPSYSTQLLRELNELSKSLGREFEIRFYGHSGEFDCSLLQYIPDAPSISIDCMTKVKNLESLSALRNLKKFHLDVFEMDMPDILSESSLQQVESLILGSTRKSNIDLGHLSNFKNLKTFHTTGHDHNLEILTKAPNLTELCLSRIKKNVRLSFVSELRALTKLLIILGGRDSIEEIECEHIKQLEIVRVRGLEKLGNIGRFKKLEEFSVKDQIRLGEIKFDENGWLKFITIINCKTLRGIQGLDLLKALKHIRIFETSIDYEEFVSQNLPDSIEILAFYTAKKKRDEEIKIDLKSRGYSECNRSPPPINKF